jgi:hypothetical protein
LVEGLVQGYRGDAAGVAAQLAKLAPRVALRRVGLIALGLPVERSWF